jgi:hypothetical protein
MATLKPWGVLSLVGADGAVLATLVVDGRGRPDLGAVDDVARFQLRAERLGGQAVIETASPFLLELLELAGLSVEVRRQPETGEDRGRAQKRVDTGDPPV